MKFLLVGFDYDLNPDDEIYFNLVKQVVAESIRLGADSVVMGQTSYALKSRFGARFEPLYFYLRHRRPLVQQLLVRFAPFLFPPTTVPSRRVFRHDS